MFYGWVVVAASLVIGVTAYGAYFSFTLFYPLLVAEFGWSRAGISGALSLGLIAYGAFALPMGWCADRFGPRLTIGLGGVLFGIGTFLGSYVSQLWHLYVLYGGITAIGMGAAWAPLVSTISRWFAVRRGLAIGIGSLGGGTGTFFVAPFVSHLLSAYSWREAYATLGIVSGTVIVLAALFMRRDPEAMGSAGLTRRETANPNRAGVQHGSGYSLAQTLKQGQFWVLVAIFGLWWFGGAIVFVQLGPFVIEKGFDLPFASKVVVAFGAGNGIGKILMGLLTDRIGGRPTLRITTLVAALGMFWLGASDSMWAVVVAAFVVGFGFGGGATQITTLCVELFGLRAIGSVMGAILALIGIVGALGPLVSGIIFDAMSSYLLAYLLGGLILVVAVEISFLLRRPVARGDWRKHEDC